MPGPARTGDNGNATDIFWLDQAQNRTAGLFGRYLHQRRHDFGLLTQLIGQALCGEDRFLDRRRIAADAAAPVLCFPNLFHDGFPKASRPVLGSDYQSFTAPQQVIVQRTHEDFNA